MLGKLSSSVAIVLSGAIVFLAAGTVSAQDIEAITRNIEPVGQVCLAGQDCSGGAAATVTPAASAPAPAADPTPAPAAQATTAPAADSSFDAAATYQQSCALCHANPAMGAPLVGDSAAWDERMAQGMETVLANAVNGVRSMPPMGMCMTCSEENMQALIEYMVGQSQ